MARYEDYVKKDDLEDEIVDAGKQSADRQSGESSFEMPERFRDKKPEEIAQSYIELEKAYSKQGNDLGNMRKTMDEYIQTALESSDQSNASDEATAKPADIDDLYDDAEGTIARVAEKAVGSRVEALEQELAQARLQNRVNALNERHGDIQAIAGTEEFREWIMGSPYRQRIAAQADQFDMDAAEELFGLWEERKGLTDLRAEAQRDEALRNATLESGAADVDIPDVTYSRSEIIDKRVRATHGDPEAKSWLQRNAEGIAIAYEEGTLTD